MLLYPKRSSKVGACIQLDYPTKLSFGNAAYHRRAVKRFKRILLGIWNIRKPTYIEEKDIIGKADMKKKTHVKYGNTGIELIRCNPNVFFKVIKNGVSWKVCVTPAFMLKESKHTQR